MSVKKAPRAIRRLAPGKFLVGELLSDDRWALVTTQAFAIVTQQNEVLLNRPWHEVATGDWDDERHILSIGWVDGSKPTRIKTYDEAPITFPRIFKERVDASVVYSETLPVSGGVLRGALRRTPKGELISQISSDEQLPQSPELEQQVMELERKLWDFVGI